MTDWSNPSERISKYFVVKEALWLPSWNVLHIPSDEEKEIILNWANSSLDRIRDFLCKPVNVHCWIRPSCVNAPGTIFHGKDCNAFVNGAKESRHINGDGTDWDCGEDCDVTRLKLEPKLAEFNIRMERKIGAPWVHCDGKLIQGNMVRYFIP